MTNEERVAEVHKTDVSVPWIVIPCENDGVKWDMITRADMWQFHICSTYGPSNVAEHIVKLHNESLKEIK